MNRLSWDQFFQQYAPIGGGDFWEITFEPHEYATTSSSRGRRKPIQVAYGFNGLAQAERQFRKVVNKRKAPDASAHLWEIIEDEVDQVFYIFPYQHRHAIGAIEAGAYRVGFMVTLHPHNFADIEVQDD